MADAERMDEFDWIGIREGLRDARLSEGIEEKELEAAGVCNKSTIYRLENVSENPTQKPDLPTIKRWLDRTTGESVADFLRKYELPRVVPADVKKVSYPVTLEVDNPDEPSAWEARRHGSVVGARDNPSLPLTTYEARLFQRFMLVALGAANTAVSEAENRSAPKAQSAGGETSDRDGGRPAPPERDVDNE